MHLPDGILTPSTIITGYAIAAAGIAAGLNKIRPDHLPRIAMLSSAFFVASLIHIPIGPTSTHLLLCALVGLILGHATLPAIFIALLLHAVMFGHGGITTLGVNTLIMGLPAIITCLLFHQPIKHCRNTLLLTILGFLAGSLAVLFAILLLAAVLLIHGRDFTQLVRIITLAHLPVIIIEGFITAAVIVTLKKLEPAIIHSSNNAPALAET